jgi:hypothetical protein
LNSGRGKPSLLFIYVKGGNFLVSGEGRDRVKRISEGWQKS